MTRTTSRRIRLAGGLLASTLIVAACSGGDDDMSGMSGMDSSSESSSAESSAESADFSDADVMFAQQMIVHHQGAVEMAQLAEERAENAQVLDLANRIEAAQGPEIEIMTGWLEDWGKPTTAEELGDAGGMDHGGMEMSWEDMAALEAASGAEFDRMFLEMMTEHHRGAVDMAEIEVANGQNAEAVALARAIIDSQTGEIEEMQGLLGTLGG